MGDQEQAPVRGDPPESGDPPAEQGEADAAHVNPELVTDDPEERAGHANAGGDTEDDSGDLPAEIPDAEEEDLGPDGAGAKPGDDVT